MKQLKLWGYELIFRVFPKIKVLLFRENEFLNNRATHSVTRLLTCHAQRGTVERVKYYFFVLEKSMAALTKFTKSG